jgi:branched-chain amino acid transport system ATP-binding protein
LAIAPLKWVAMPDAAPSPQAGTPPAGENLLTMDKVVTYYGSIAALKGVSIEVARGEVICLLGGNASGKSTTMKAILGMVAPRSGSIVFAGERIDGMATQTIVAKGIALVPEARRLFGRMTVWENLAMGAFTRRHEPPGELAQDLERVYGLFPRLSERRTQYAGTLSGGEQQMVAIGRALMARPRLILMDEPSMGLAPVFVDQVFDIISTINRQGTTILVVEQNAAVALSIAHRGYVLQNGRIVIADTAAALLRADAVRRAYLGEV